MTGYADGAFDDLLVCREIARRPQFDTPSTRRAYARHRAEELRNQKWSPDNEKDRKSRIRAYERYADGKL